MYKNKVTQPTRERVPVSYMYLSVPKAAENALKTSHPRAVSV